MVEQKVSIPWEGWKCVKPIGKGGFGTVYEIQRIQHGITEKAAMKKISIPQSADEVDNLRIEGYDNESIARRFFSFAEDIVREYGIMAQMKGNANIVYCDDYKIVQQDDGFGWDIYIKMELLTPLVKALDQVSSEAQIIRFGMDMCTALDLCQKRNVIYRDIKPQNILVSDDGVFKLGDFGVARTAEKTTRATVGIGTYQFMAPEVKNERPYGPTVDIYSLGLVMYWLLNERRSPFLPLPPAVPTHSDEQNALKRRFSGEQIPAPRSGSEGLKRIVLKACAFAPKDRYQSAREMREALMRLSDGYVPELQTEHIPTPESVPELDFGDEETVDSGFVPKPSEDSENVDRTVSPRFPAKTDDAAKTKAASMKKRGRNLLLPVAAVILLIIGYFTVHIWTDASCTEAPVCKICGKTRSSIPGHKWKDATCTAPKTCEVCGLKSGEAAGHQWSSATCTVSKTCEVCGQESGEATGHQWSAATCTAPATCEVCGLESGAAAGHQWVEATYFAPKTCSVCHATEGKPIDNPLIAFIRQRLPIVTYAMGSDPCVYGYEDAALTRKVDSHYLDLDGGEIVIADISEDGTALQISFPTEVTASGYDTLWFAFTDIIPLQTIEIIHQETDKTVNTYRMQSFDDELIRYGALKKGWKFYFMGEHESGCYVITYTIYQRQLYNLSIKNKIALVQVRP